MSSRFVGGVGGEGMERWPRERPGPFGGKRVENRRKKLEMLCEGGLRLFLDRGIEGVTVEDLAKEAGIAKGSFYRYVRDKEELVEAIFRPAKELFEQGMDRCEEALKLAETNEELLLAYETLALDLTAAMFPYLDVMLLYLQEYRAPAVNARKPVRVLADMILQKALDITAAAHEHGLLRPIPHRVSTLVVIGAVERLLFGFLTEEPLGEPQEVGAALIAMMLDGIRSKPQVG